MRGAQAWVPTTPGEAIISRHIDVFRPPPSNPADTGNFATGQPVYIVAPGRPLP